MSLILLKNIHIFFVVTSFISFLMRTILVYADYNWKANNLSKYTPIIIDGLVISSGLLILKQYNYALMHIDWFKIKLTTLSLYFIFSILAFYVARNIKLQTTLYIATIVSFIATLFFVFVKPS